MMIFQRTGFARSRAPWLIKLFFISSACPCKSNGTGLVVVLKTFFFLSPLSVNLTEEFCSRWLKVLAWLNKVLPPNIISSTKAAISLRVQSKAKQSPHTHTLAAQLIAVLHKYTRNDSDVLHRNTACYLHFEGPPSWNKQKTQTVQDYYVIVTLILWKHTEPSDGLNGYCSVGGKQEAAKGRLPIP